MGRITSLPRHWINPLCPFRGTIDSFEILRIDDSVHSVNPFGRLDELISQRTRRSAPGNMNGPVISMRVLPLRDMVRLKLQSTSDNTDSSLFEKRQQVAKLPPLRLPIIIITRSGSGIHHEIGTTPTAQNLSLGDNAAASADRLAFPRDVKHCGLFSRVEEFAVQCRGTHGEVVAVCSTCFNEEDGRFGGCFCEAACNDTTCCAA